MNTDKPALSAYDLRLVRATVNGQPVTPASDEGFSFPRGVPCTLNFIDSSGDAQTIHGSGVLSADGRSIDIWSAEGLYRVNLTPAGAERLRGSIERPKVPAQSRAASFCHCHPGRPMAGCPNPNWQS